MTNCTRVYTAICKQTGRAYSYEIKHDWGKRRVSVDSGRTWHPKLSVAKQDAKSRNVFRYDGDAPITYFDA